MDPRLMYSKAKSTASTRIIPLHNGKKKEQSPAIFGNYMRAASSENVPSNMFKMRRFRSFYACAKYHPGHCCPLIQAVVSHYSDSRQWRPRSACADGQQAVVSHYSDSGQWRPWSDCADAQADLGLRCPHMPEDTFSHGAAHIWVCDCLCIFRACIVYTANESSTSPCSYWIGMNRSGHPQTVLRLHFCEHSWTIAKFLFTCNSFQRTAASIRELKTHFFESVGVASLRKFVHHSGVQSTIMKYRLTLQQQGTSREKNVPFLEVFNKFAHMTYLTGWHHMALQAFCLTKLKNYCFFLWVSQYNVI